MTSYSLNPLPPQIAPGQLDRLSQVEPATLGHHLHAMFADLALRPVIEGRRAAGTAVTVQIPGPDSTLLYYALDRVRPGDFLVIDRAGDKTHACWGGFMAAVARVRGLAGVVVDGAITDPEAIRQAGVPTWGRAPSACTTKLLGLGGAMNVPVSIGGVAVVPGDAVLADDCGIVILPAASLDPLIDMALAEQAEESDWLERIEAGARLQDLVDIEAIMKLKAGAEHA
ncbi:MAG: RraA family protein [Rhodobacteraceae bacterium]|jgi:regulator of RNase E activity RraA|nr:RraA family protein [Paracoccaceae bacterium]